METLFTPWRWRFVSSSKPVPSCFFCDAAAEPDDPDRLVVHRSPHHLVMLNRYPYTNGHLMVAPREHLADPSEASEEARSELWPLTLTARRVLERAYAPDGLNLGMNLGSAAGAGVPDHFHLHLVPRWNGDTNFASVVGEVRLVPEALDSTRRRLRELFAADGGE